MNQGMFYMFRVIEEYCWEKKESGAFPNLIFNNLSGERGIITNVSRYNEKDHTFQVTLVPFALGPSTNMTISLEWLDGLYNQVTAIQGK